MGVINSPLVEGGVFSEEVNKKEVAVNGVNSNKKSVRITIILHTLFAIISLLLYIVSYTVLCDLKITFFVFQKGCLKNQSYYTTGNYFSDTYGKHHKRNRKIYSVSEVKYEWHDDCIGNNRRDRRKKTVAAAESVSKYCSDQCAMLPK